MPRPCPTAGHEQTRAGTWRTKSGHVVDKVWRHGQSGLQADTWRTHGGHNGGHMEYKAWRQAQGGHMADARRTHGGQGLEAHPKCTPGGHKADTRRTHHGGHKANGSQALDEHKADTWPMADTLRTAPGTRPEHIAASLFFLRENSMVNCLGNESNTQASLKALRYAGCSEEGKGRDPRQPSCVCVCVGDCGGGSWNNWRLKYSGPVHPPEPKSHAWMQKQLARKQSSPNNSPRLSCCKPSRALRIAELARVSSTWCCTELITLKIYIQSISCTCLAPNANHANQAILCQTYKIYNIVTLSY